VNVSPVMPRRNASSSLAAKEIINKREVSENENVAFRKEKVVLMENNNDRNDRKSSNSRID